MKKLKKICAAATAVLVAGTCTQMNWENSLVNAESDVLTSSFDSTTDGWSARGTCSVKVSSSAYKGDGSLYVSGRTNSWNGALISVDDLLGSNDTYDFSAYVMYDEGESEEEFYMSMQYSDQSGKVVYDHMALQTIKKGAWTEISVTGYEVPSGASDLTLYFETPESKIDFYIDEVKITSTGEGSSSSQGSSGNKTGFLFGDVNHDDVLNIADVVALKSLVLEGETEEYNRNAVLDADAEIGATDVKLMYQYMSGEISEFPAESLPPVKINGDDDDIFDDSYDANYKEPLSGDTLKMAQDSFYRCGNTYRLLKKIAQAKRGETTTIGYLGGSITEGSNAGANDCYARKSYEYFASEYGTGNNVKYVNAGLSGTSSVLGVYRAQRDLLSKNPDVIFIEYSVNDQGSTEFQKSFESLCKQCLMQENEPAVIVLVTRSETGGSCQEQMAKVAKNYDLGLISVDNAVSNAINSGKMKWGDYGSDQFHPHKSGHQLVANFIEYYWRQAQLSKNRSTSYEIPSTTVFGDQYATGTMVDFSELKDFNAGSFKKGTSIQAFPNGYTFSKNGNTPMTFTVEGKGIALLFKSNASGMGTAVVSVNGKQYKVTANKQYTWGGPDADCVFVQDKTETLKVSISMENGSSNYELLGIGVYK